MNGRDGFPTLPESEGNWRCLLTLGAGLILLGVVELGSVVVTELFAILMLGPLLMACGLMQILLACFARQRREAPLHLVAAALDLVVGFLVLTHPRNTVDDLILVLAAFLMVGGASRILCSLFLRVRAWGWIDVKHFGDIERLAFVGDRKWEAGMATFCKPFTRAAIRYFDESKYEEALDWIKEGIVQPV